MLKTSSVLRQILLNFYYILVSLSGEIKRSSSRYYFTSKTKLQNYSEGNVSNNFVQLHLSFNFHRNALHELLHDIKNKYFQNIFRKIYPMLIKWRYKLEENKNFNWERSPWLILFSKIHKLYFTAYYKFANTSSFAHFLERAVQPIAIKIRHLESDQKTVRLLTWKHIDMSQANYIQMDEEANRKCYLKWWRCWHGFFIWYIRCLKSLQLQN